MTATDDGSQAARLAGAELPLHEQPHMLSLAAGLQRIMRAKWPEYAWVCTVREDDRDVRTRESRATVGNDHPGAQADHPYPVFDRDPASATGAADHDSLDEAA